MQSTFCFSMMDQIPFFLYQEHFPTCRACQENSEPLALFAKLTRDKQSWRRWKADIQYALGLISAKDIRKSQSLLFEQLQQKVKCLKCKEFCGLQQIIYLDKCTHLFCRPCLSKYISQDFLPKKGVLKCLVAGCAAQLGDQDLLQCLPGQRLEAMRLKIIEENNNIVECLCKRKFAFQKGNVRDVETMGLKDINGNKLTAAAITEYADNRYFCRECKVQRCKKCLATPYHAGMTCDQSKKNQDQRKCRFCQQPLGEKQKCASPDCLALIAQSCNKTLPCGHQCLGSLNQPTCLPCLQQTCAQKNQALKGLNQNQFCNICWTQALKTAPCIQSKCGHIFHLKCIKKRLQIRWLSPRIMFNFCLCPLCKAWMLFEEGTQTQAKMTEFKSLFDKVLKKSFERLTYEGRDKDKQVAKGGQYEGRPKDYAMAIYAYFQCFKCKEPYFGGMKNCQQALNEGKADYKPDELVCSECCDIKSEDCKKHGKQYIQFKCKFCCKVAQWFCWNTTHFCQPCHVRQVKGDYLTKYELGKLPVCDKKNCPIGGSHPPNGQEHSLGCALCRNLDNKKF